MDMNSCESCLLFKEKFKDMKIETTKGKTPIPVAVLNGLPRNGDGSINYEDLVFALNARKVLNDG